MAYHSPSLPARFFNRATAVLLNGICNFILSSTVHIITLTIQYGGDILLSHLYFRELLKYLPILYTDSCYKYIIYSILYLLRTFPPSISVRTTPVIAIDLYPHTQASALYIRPVPTPFIRQCTC